MGKVAKNYIDRRREILGVILLSLTALLFVALVTDGHQGSSRRMITDLGGSYNAFGKLGAFSAGFLYILFGQASHILYCVIGAWGVMLIRHRPFDRLPMRLTGLLLVAFSTAGLLHIDFAEPQLGNVPGGAIGAFVASLFVPLFHVIGANVLVITVGIIGLLLSTDFLFLRAFQGAHILSILVVRTIALLYQTALGSRDATRKSRGKRPWRRVLDQLDDDDISSDVEDDEDDLSRIKVRHTPSSVSVPTPLSLFEDESEKMPFEAPSVPETASAPVPETNSSVPFPASKPVMARGNGGAAAKPALRRKLPEVEELPEDYVYPKRYTLPSMDMLDAVENSTPPDLGDMLRQTSRLLEEKLLTFGIEAQVTDVTRGPTITRFELEPAAGIKVSRFLGLADDLALALKAHPVRVEAPIPGKGRVGIEVPNEVREPVVMRQLLESREFRRVKGKLPLALGKDIAGDVIAADMTTMPHLLVAGATGAGKTVCVKSLLASLLFTKTPEELQLMLIDPKMVELSIFNDIPHLITPVVIDPKKAATALNWLIVEMEERYRLFAHLRVRNIDVYNESVENGEIEMPVTPGQVADSVDVIRKLPYIVCIIDELADLMMLARAEVEDAIGRLAQLARAVGIHLIIATQRPSVDVLTGVIKANFPARISFQVSSRVDSRCILDEIGAERLIGRGDMLYLPAGQSKPTRIQGAFVSDEEMNNLIAYLKTQAPPQYRDEIERFGKKEAQGELLEEDDELFDEAVRVVLETSQASISMVQRRLRVGYTRAARLIDMMELKGIVGPHTGSKAREILVDYPRPQNEVA